MQDRYIPGVPCLVDVTAPDPAAAVRRLAALVHGRTPVPAGPVAREAGRPAALR